MPINLLIVLDVAWKSTALLAAAWLIVPCLRHKSAALRHQVWCLAIAAVLIVPFLSAMLPPVQLPAIKTLMPDGLPFRADAYAANQQIASTHSHPPSLPAAAQLRTSGNVLVGLWSLGAALSLLQMLVGWLKVERLSKNAKRLNLPELSHSVEVRETAAGHMPFTYGFLRPAILLPADAREWTAECRHIVLLHELAHVRRKDGATRLLSRFALAMYWWHPLVWKAWRESLSEQERAADDMVLNAGPSPADYAKHLLEVARSLHTPVGLGSAALTMARPSQLEGRLAAILNAKQDRQIPRRAATMGASLLALALVVPVAALHASGQVRSAAKTAPASQETVLMQQGKTALSGKNYELAASCFERAQAADPQNAAEAEMWLAITQQLQENRQVAADLYKTALNLAEPNSPNAATIMELYEKLLRDLNRSDEAGKIAAQAARIRQVQGEQTLASKPPSPFALHIGGDVHGPKLLSKTEPQYSEDARLARYSGTVLLAIEIGADGLPQNIRVARGIGLGLEQKAVEAVSQWKFGPGTQNGQAVKVAAQVEVSFQLL